jgi:hypothetical protein
VKALFDAKTRMNSWFCAFFSPESLIIGPFMNGILKTGVFIDVFEPEKFAKMYFRSGLKKSFRSIFMGIRAI